MTTETRKKIDALNDGQAHTAPEPDWELITELIGVELEEYECDYEDYIMGRAHQTTFIKGDLKADGHTSSRDIVEGYDGYTPPTEYNEAGVVILGNLEVTGNLELDELTPLFVSGNVKAGSIMNLYGTLVAGGSIEAELIYCQSADEGGQTHTDDCKTKLLIDASGNLDYHCAGDYPFLLANYYSPRQRYTLQRSLEELGFEDFGTTLSTEMRATVSEGPERVAKLLELIEKNRDAKPESVPDDAEWSEDYPSGYRLAETDENGEPHGLDGHWGADGTVKHLKNYKHGKPHGEWKIERNGMLQTRYYEEGEPARPEGVPDAAVWKEDDWEWELAATDSDGEMHGDVKWWRPDGTLACESSYVHGVAQGEGRRYHESGEVSRTYTFVDGQLHGESIFYGTENYTTERSWEGINKKVARYVYVYDKGTWTSSTFYDHDGNEVDRYGNPA